MVSGYRQLLGRVIGLMVGLLPLAAPAAEQAQTPAQAPSLELLEFMGAWETHDGEWLDPLTLLASGDRGGQKEQTEDQKHD